MCFYVDVAKMPMLSTVESGDGYMGLLCLPAFLFDKFKNTIKKKKKAISPIPTTPASDITIPCPFLLMILCFLLLIWSQALINKNKT